MPEGTDAEAREGLALTATEPAFVEDGGGLLIGVIVKEFVDRLDDGRSGLAQLRCG